MNLSKESHIYREKYGKYYTFSNETLAAAKNLYHIIIDDPDILVTSITGMPSQNAKSEDAFVLLLSALSRI